MIETEAVSRWMRNIAEGGASSASRSNALIGVTWLIATTVAPGQRVTLILDVDLQPNMHAYAPGVAGGYISIDWKMPDSPAAAVHPAIFPRSEKLYLKAIGETVPAYRNHFRLTRDITIARPLDASGEFTVAGALRYQACDDRVCYIPQQLHLAWTFKFVQAPE